MVLRKHLKFLVIYRVLSWHEWKRAGVLYGDFTRDAILIFLFQVYILVQQAKYLSLYRLIIGWVSQASYGGVFALTSCTLLSTQNGRRLLRLRKTTPRLRAL